MNQIRIESSTCFVEHAALADVGRMLTWLGENCETFSFRLTSAQPVTQPDQVLTVQVGFQDHYEATAFQARFLPSVGWNGLQ